MGAIDFLIERLHAQADKHERGARAGGIIGVVETHIAGAFRELAEDLETTE